MAHITTDNDHEIDVDKFRMAVFALMYNEPHLRAVMQWTFSSQ